MPVIEAQRDWDTGQRSDGILVRLPKFHLVYEAASVPAPDAKKANHNIGRRF